MTTKKVAHASEGYVAEADFDDFIAKNRVVPVVAASTIPAIPKGFRLTDPATRNKRLRRLDGDLRSEGLDALRETSKHGDLKALLGPHAPDPKRADALVTRMAHVAELLGAASALYEYARELDQITASDVVVFLEAENKEFLHAVDHEPALATKFPALKRFFDARAASISEGIARSKHDPASSTSKDPAAKTEPSTS